MSQEHLTVRQVIEKLQQFDRDAVVMIDCEDHYYTGPLRVIEPCEAGFYQTSSTDRSGRVHNYEGIWVLEPDEDQSHLFQLEFLKERKPGVRFRTPGSGD